MYSVTLSTIEAISKPASIAPAVGTLRGASAKMIEVSSFSGRSTERPYNKTRFRQF